MGAPRQHGLTPALLETLKAIHAAGAGGIVAADIAMARGVSMRCSLTDVAALKRHRAIEWRRDLGSSRLRYWVAGMMPSRDALDQCVDRRITFAEVRAELAEISRIVVRLEHRIGELESDERAESDAGQTED